MNTMTLDGMKVETASDEGLWQASLEGDRRAFGGIVDRYKALICALAYSGTGNLAGSEDLAQETFVKAWQRLGELREPAKLRQWLCGIVRNLAADERRKVWRRGGPAVELAEVAEVAQAASADPEAAAVEREEEALVWRALEGLPERYREPMVLFYREEQSIAEVASRLDLTEDAARQRLSRGRAKLRMEMTALVEGALARSRPTAAFTAAVLASVATLAPPPASALATSSTLAATASSTAAKGGAAGAVGGPFLGFATAWLASKLAGATLDSAGEAAIVDRAFRRAILFTFAMVALLLLGLGQGLAFFQAQPGWLVAGATSWTLLLVGGLIGVATKAERALADLRAVGGAGLDLASDRAAFRLGPWRWQSRRRLAGLPLVAVSTAGFEVRAASPGAARGWIAIGDVALSPLLAVGGLAVGPIAFGGATVGLLSVSVAGLALGGLALGTLAFGYWAYGPLAVGWEAAAGGVALAQDFAVGGLARAAEANSAAAAAYFAASPLASFAKVYWEQVVVWLVLACIVIPLSLMSAKAWTKRARRAGR